MRLCIEGTQHLAETAKLEEQVLLLMFRHMNHIDCSMLCHEAKMIVVAGLNLHMPCEGVEACEWSKLC